LLSEMSRRLSVSSLASTALIAAEPPTPVSPASPVNLPEARLPEPLIAARSRVRALSRHNSDNSVPSAVAASAGPSRTQLRHVAANQPPAPPRLTPIELNAGVHLTKCCRDQQSVQVLAWIDTSSPQRRFCWRPLASRDAAVGGAVMSHVRSVTAVGPELRLATSRRSLTFVALTAQTATQWAAALNAMR
jgi:hypothetical protein